MKLFLSVFFLLSADSRVIKRCNANKLASVGEICGGPLEPSIKCKDGLECFYPTGLKDLPGICRVIASPTSDIPTLTDSIDTSTLTSKIVGKGEHCGGFIMNAPKCSPGLKCILDTIPDVGGTCT